MARGFVIASSMYLENTSFSPFTGPPFTIAAWAYSNTATAGQAIISLSASGEEHYYGLFAAGNVAGDPFRGLLSTPPTPIAATSTGYSVDTWHHGCYIAAASDDHAVYIDGGSKGTSSTSATLGSNIDRVRIGTSADDTPTGYLGGRIADAAVWNVALTDAEVAVLAAGYTALMVRPQSLVAYWPLIGRTSPEIDLVGGYNMTLNNSPTTAAHPPIIYPSAPPYVPATASAAPPAVAAYRRRLIFALGGI